MRDRSAVKVWSLSFPQKYFPDIYAQRWYGLQDSWKRGLWHEKSWKIEQDVGDGSSIAKYVYGSAMSLRLPCLPIP